jgi:pyruvate,orthophosphate dikinase
MPPNAKLVTGDDVVRALGEEPVVLLDGNARGSRKALGNKGFGIDVMRGLGLPVPPAFCLSTGVCAALLAGDGHVLDRVWPDVLDKLRWLEAETSRTFGRGPRPLLLSVRSGAAQSMPGMLDTVLDLGINDEVHRALAAQATPEFAADTRSRFQTMYRRIVVGADASADIPDDPFVQLRDAIEAVFASWHTPRAVAYRAHHGLDGHMGTAVVVQAMVFGNLGPDSGTGVLFSRNPATGADEPLGEWLPGAQGEDVVSGTLDCLPLDALRAAHPRVFTELMAAADQLERLSRDVQDIEFTVESGQLWLLQTRVAKRSPQAAVRLALKFRDAGLIDDAEAVRRVTPEQVRTLVSPALQPETRLAARLLAKGLPASPGIASGMAYNDVDDALDAAAENEDVILVRTSTSPDDVAGMMACRGIVTEFGGTTSHAAVVSRELGKPAVVGCGAGVATALVGNVITIDGGEGEVREGALELVAWSEHDNPDLIALTALVRGVSPLRAHAAGTHPVLADTGEVGVRDALSAGHTDVVCDKPLLAMLTAVRLADGPGDPLHTERSDDG